jgi:type IV pilus assembly protein PilW
LEAELKKSSPKNRRFSSGFSLVEIMVALVIGMFGVLIMMQVLSASEGQKRTVTSGNDAMNEGLMALYNLQSEIRTAGYGFTDLKVLGCNLTLPTGVTLAGGLAPVNINHPSITIQDVNTDTLLIVYGNTMGTTQGDQIIQTTSGTIGPIMQTPDSFVRNDWVVVAGTTRPSYCTKTLYQVDDFSTTPPKLLNVPPYAFNVGDRVFNLGQSVKVVGYAIYKGNLNTCDFSAKTCATPADWSSISDNIVSLTAQYGRDTSGLGVMDGIVDIFDNTTPNLPPGPVVPDPSCTWARIESIRLAIVARSNQPEQVDPVTNLPVTTNAPVWDGTAPNNPNGSTATSTQRPINLNGIANWQNYRYKVFQTLVPIRNITWMGSGAGPNPQGVPSC